MALTRGTQKAELHPVFLTLATQLMADAAVLSQSTLGTAQRTWQMGPSGSWSGNPLDVPGISTAFDRSAIHENYAACLSDPDAAGTVADTQALTLQNDWVVVRERAFRVRHSTSVRAAVHAAARRAGHAHPQGVIGAGAVKYLQDLIKRGA